jgi:ABC-type branched-subunit amino acid transport system substrate-binding protein
MRCTRGIAIAALLTVLAVSCSRSDSDSTSSTTLATATACHDVDLGATDVGVTAETITIEVMADIGSPFAPGLFQGNVDAVKGYADYINRRGGVACRKLVVRVWDSKLKADEAKNGHIDACHSALALVGGNTLFNPDPSAMANCPDKGGVATGLPDVAAIAVDIHEICNPTTFIVTGVNESCPVPSSGPIEFTFGAGGSRYIAQRHPGLHGLYLLPGDLPTTIQSGLVIARSIEEAGLRFDAKPKVSGRSEQSAFTPLIQLMRDHRSNFVLNGSSDSVMIKMRKETAAQGFDGVKLWMCILSCYTSAFRAAGDVVDGTYVTLSFLPFEEKAYNDELAAYIDSVGKSRIDSWGAEAWQAAGLFKQAMDDVVERHGPNGVTRAALLAALARVHDFSDNGWVGSVDPRSAGGCFVLLQLRDGAFRRVHPTKKGTLDCNPDNLVTYSFDAIAEAAKLP